MGPEGEAFRAQALNDLCSAKTEHGLSKADCFTTVSVRAFFMRGLFLFMRGCGMI